MEMALSGEMQLCLAWTITEWRVEGNSLTSPPFFLKKQRCQLTFSRNRYKSNNKSKRGIYRFSLRIKADRGDQSNYRTSVSVEHGKVAGLLSTSGVFGHPHSSPQTIWKYTGSEILKTFPGLYKSKDPFKFVLSFFSTTPGDDGKGMEPTLLRAKSEKEQPVKTAEVATTSLNLNAVSCLENLSEDLSKLMDGGLHQDVEFKCEGGVVRAHSNLLSTRSRVLAAMLRSDMAEGRTGHVEIRDMEAELFRCFIRYLYTGKLPALTIDTAIRLYEAGDKYEVEGLTRRCSQFLKKNLSPANACNLLVLAEAHSDQHFKDEVVVFIVKQRIFLKDDRWLAFSDGHPKLAHEVLNRFCKQEFREK